MLHETVRNVLRRIDDVASSVDTLGNDADLFEAGLSSYGTVEVMVGLESALGIEFPEQMLTRDTFSSINALVRVLQTLRPATAMPAAGSDAVDANGWPVATETAR
ncbi:acyl carrier protein [Belnapia rosea]|uniref:Acyl carrier protein n=1 Tax=Belnapia rosea TaxID=938405 RepID=A0A1G6S1I3_9PROT|nr:acyl carrier protein [Belnapia rosea]SDB72038.1 Acyl carrier protein [Belnapia rosea]SDD10027.1 Acyl carrier protein [Belnapia rosea]